MRSFVSLAAAVSMLFASTGATPLDSSGALAGHWRCAVAGGRPAERSYFVVTGKLGPTAGRREVFGRQDTTLPDGTPSASIERMAETADGGATVAAVEGEGTAPNGAASLRFTGRTYDGNATMELAYTIAGETMRRTAKRGSATVDDETCTRQPEALPVAPCARPDHAAQTLRVVEPFTPFEAYQAKVKGVVNVRVVLDDQSRVLWLDVLKSASPLLNDTAMQAARDATFLTATVNCRPVAAEYVFSVDFE